MFDVLGIKNIKNIKSRIFLFYILSVVNLFIYASENIFNCCNLSFINTKNSEEVNTNKNISDDYDGEIYEGKDIEQDSIYNMPNINNILDKIYTLKEGNYKHKFNTGSNILNLGNSVEINPQPFNEINISTFTPNNIEEKNDENIFIPEENEEILNNNSKNISHSELQRIKKTNSKKKKRRNTKSEFKEEDFKTQLKKYPLNNLIGKTKRILVKNLLLFINAKICELVNIEALLKFIKKEMSNIPNLAFNKIKKGKTFLLPLNGTLLDDSSIDNNKILLEQHIGAILSNNISGKIKWYCEEFNKKIIEFLYQNSEKLKEILEVSFIDFVKYFCEKGNTSCKNSDSIPSSWKELEKWPTVKRRLVPQKQYTTEYLDCIEFLLKNYEKLICQRKKKKD